MENINIEGIGNFSLITNMFEQDGCVEGDNCIFVTQTWTSSEVPLQARALL